VWDEVEEGVAQQSARGEAEQHLQQVLVLVAVGLDRDQEQDEERRGADEQSRSDGLRTGNGGRVTLLYIFFKNRQRIVPTLTPEPEHTCVQSSSVSLLAPSASLFTLSPPWACPHPSLCTRTPSS